MKYDLVIAYRIYPKVSKIPPIYPEDKYNLSKLCLGSFKKSLEGLKVKMYVILDNCPEEYKDLFTLNFNDEELTFIPIEIGGNKNTFKKQIDILTNQNDSEIVYFAEDDYFYIKNIKDIVKTLKNKEADFISPYEHPDCYSNWHVINKKIIIINNQRFLTVQHACLTFATRKDILIKNKNKLLIYSNWFASDFVMWGCLTLGISYFKHLKIFLKYKNINIDNIKVFGSMLFFSWYNFILNKKYILLMPIDTIATHMESNFLSPCIDWPNYFNKK